ncbi:hypothetical protein RQX22_09255 [Sphingosinicella sp. GR2756]|uniref:Uncharacterized protein n=2 Tax=Sphingosinicella rhizophila TaxID=3050082 RepID=A0ABU3Q7S6_9SPHN|nr:hypothetical protein [Sphingosinicella sp. GR2756]
MMEDTELADDPVSHIFRLIDPVKEIFVLLGQKHDFGSVRPEVQRVAELAGKIA